MKVLIVISVFLALASAEPPVYRQQNQQQRRYYFARQEEEPAPVAPVAAPYPASGWKPDGPSFDLPQKQAENSYGPPRPFVRRNQTPQQQYDAPDSQAETQPQENQQQDQQQQQRFGNSANQQQQQRFWNSEFQARQQQQQFGASQNQFQQRQYVGPAAVQPQNNQYGVPEPQEEFQPPQPDQEYGVPLSTTEEPSTTTEIEDSTTTSTPQTDSEVEPVNSVNELDEEGDLDDQQAQQQQQRQEGEYYVALPDGRLQRIRYVSHEDIEAMKYFARIRAENVEPLRGPIYSYSPLQQLQFAPTSFRQAPNTADSSPASSTAYGAPASSAKLELQEEEAAPSPPLVATVQYNPYDAPSSVIPLGGASGYSANYRVPASAESRYIISFP